MLGTKAQASPAAHSVSGKAVRRARNILKRYAGKPDLSPKAAARVARAQAVLTYATLAKT